MPVQAQGELYRLPEMLRIANIQAPVWNWIAKKGESLEVMVVLIKAG